MRRILRVMTVGLVMAAMSSVAMAGAAAAQGAERTPGFCILPTGELVPAVIITTPSGEILCAPTGAGAPQ